MFRVLRYCRKDGTQDLNRQNQNQNRSQTLFWPLCRQALLDEEAERCQAPLYGSVKIEAEVRMPRAGRSFEEGRVYHVYNRLGGGLRLFSDDDLAGVFVNQLREAVERDDAVVFAWCLLGAHYHLVIR